MFDTESIIIIKVLGAYLLGLIGLSIVSTIVTSIIFRKIDIR